MRTILSAALIAGFAFAFSANPGTAFAAEEGDKPRHPDPAKFFEKKDTNKDGKLSKEEFLTDVPQERAEKAAERFAKMDTDADGFVTLAEFKAALEKAAENRKKKEGEGNDKN